MRELVSIVSIVSTPFPKMQHYFRSRFCGSNLLLIRLLTYTIRPFPACGKRRHGSVRGRRPPQVDRLFLSSSAMLQMAQHHRPHVFVSKYIYIIIFAIKFRRTAKQKGELLAIFKTSARRLESPKKGAFRRVQNSAIPIQYHSLKSTLHPKCYLREWG